MMVISMKRTIFCTWTQRQRRMNAGAHISRHDNIEQMRNPKVFGIKTTRVVVPRPLLVFLYFLPQENLTGKLARLVVPSNHHHKQNLS